jgi:methylglyoxal synthase
MKIALIAHDKKKDEIIELAKQYKDVLANYELYATGTTGTLVMGETALPIRRMKSGPLGGDQQIGARIVDGKIDVAIFFSDPLTAQPHDPDVKALLRIAQVYDIPIANNRATADFIIKSPLMDKPYSRMLLNFRKEVEKRADGML